MNPTGTKIGNVFKNMLSTCPMELSAYGKCVAASTDNIEKGACEKEFQAIKKCFRKVRPLKK